MTSALFKGGKHAQLYSQFRPYPPKELIDRLIVFCREKFKLEPPFSRAIDVGCGSGQSTVALSPFFKNVFGIDVSDAQVKCAKEFHSLPNIEYKVSEGEKLPVPSSSTQLVTLCQSIHWFNPPDNLYKEIKRILMPNGVVAAYGYWIPFPKTDDNKINDDIHGLIYDYLHEEKLGLYWDKERYIVENKYNSIDFPFKDKQRIELVNQTESSLADYIGYLSTWSAYQKFLAKFPKHAPDLLEEVHLKLKSVLNSTESSHKIRLKLHTSYFMLIGYQ